MVLCVCIVLISLHWQPMWIIITILIINVSHELQLPDSTKGFIVGGGRGVDLYFVYRRIYGELLLIFVLYFNCHSYRKKIIFKDAFSSPPPPPPSSDSIWNSFYQWDYLFILFLIFFLLLTTLEPCFFSSFFLSTRPVWRFIVACTLIFFFFQVKKKAWICQSF